MPIVHPFYLHACCRAGAKVDTTGYLLPLGRSALGGRGLILPLRSSRGRPFQGKTVVLCMDGPAAVGGKVAVEDWAFILSVAGATVKVLEDGGGGGAGGGGGCRGSEAGASTATTKGGDDDNRCTLDGGRQLLAEGRIHSVVAYTSIHGGAPQASTAVSAFLQEAVTAGTRTGTLEWAAQCLAHGHLLPPSAETCPWFPVGAAAAAAGGPTDRTSAAPGGGRPPKAEAGRSASGGGWAGSGGGGGGGVFHVHVSGGRTYVAGDYVFLGDREDAPSSAGRGGPAGGKDGPGTEGTRSGAGALPLVARIASFRGAASGTVRVAVDVLDRGDDGSRVLVSAGGPLAGRRGLGRQEVDESTLGGRVLVLSGTEAEAEAARLYSSKDSGIFCLGD